MAGEPHTGQRPVTPTLALISRLQADRRMRDTRGLFFVEGVRNFITALECGYTPDTLIYSERLLTAPSARQLVRQLRREGVPFTAVSPEQFRSVSRAEKASGVGAILRQRITPIENVAPGDGPCWIALDLVRSPGNLGSLMRTAAAAGAAGFIFLGAAVDPFDPAVVRAAMGALYRQMLVRASLDAFADWVRRHGLCVVGASPDGKARYDEMRYPRPVVLMLGEERRGLTPEQRALCHHLVRIPMAPGTDSLNLTVAGSLLVYETLRQSLNEQMGVP